MKTDTKLPFPFVVVEASPFADIPNMREVLAALPAEFKRDNQWSDYASNLFFRGGNVEVTKAANPEQRSIMLRYLKTWLGSFKPRHEDKTAVCGWLLSLMMEKPLK